VFYWRASLDNGIYGSVANAARELRKNFYTIMKSPNSLNLPGLEDKSFLLLVIAVSLAFAWILWPYSGAVLWATVLAIVFAPLYRRLSRSMRQKRTLAALATLLVIVMIVILPLTLVTALLLQEGFSVYERIQSGELHIGLYFKQIFGALPSWVTDLLDRFELTNLNVMQERLSSGLMKTSQFLATQALNIGQNTFEFVIDLFIVLYLLFFFLRDLPGASGTRFRCTRSNNAISSTSSPRSSAPPSKGPSWWRSCKGRSED